VNGYGADIVCTADEVVVWVRNLGWGEVAEATIRQWANRGQIARHGTRGRRILYSLAEVQLMLESRLDQPSDLV
jgi:GH24 family phage-related lysozyme (muramidase)